MWRSNMKEEGTETDENRGGNAQPNNSELTIIELRFCQQMRQSTVVPESSALLLRRSISNTVERKPAEEISLHQACKDDIIDVVQELLSDKSCDVNAIDSQGYSPLHYAAKYDHEDIAKLLLDHGADPDLHDTCTRTLTPLQLACWFNSAETAHVLIGNGADVSTGARYGQLAIHCAAARGGTRIMEELIVTGKANPNYKDNSGFTPLHLAATIGRIDIVNVLLKYGANIILQDNDGNTPAHIAAREGHVTTLMALLQSAQSSVVSMRHILESTGSGSCLQLAVKKSHVEAAKVCLQYGASTYGNTHDTSPPLHTACILGNLNMVKLLVSSGASIHAEDIEGMTPILRTSLSGHVDVINYLINQGASLEAVGPYEPSPLMCAVKRGNADVIRLLLTRGSSIDVRDSSNRTCLHVAVYSENQRTLDTLLKHGGRLLVNSQDKSEYTPLHFAAINHNLKMILKLLDFGADTNIYDEEEKLPLHHAAEAGDLDCFKALVAVNHSSIHATDLRLRTPLFYAALENKHDIIKCLIENGARVNSRDDDRLTPLLAIAPVGSIKAVTMLLDHGAKIDDLSKNRTNAFNVAAMYGNTDVIKVLLDRGASIDNVSVMGNGGLGSAIVGGRGQACMEIIKHKRWKEAVKFKGCEGFTCMKGLIEKFPEVAKVVMDKCIVTSNHLTTDDENYSITYNFEFLNVHPDEKSNAEGYVYFGPQTMVQSGAPRELLFHPLTTQLLDMKWNTFARYHTGCALLFYVLFVVNITLYVICLGQLDSKTGKMINVNPYNLCSRHSLYVQSLGVSIFTTTWTLAHIYRLFKERWNYFDRYNLIEDTTLFACLMASSFGKLDKEQFGWGIVALLMCYLTLLFYIQTIFNSGIYVTMLFGVLKSLLKVLATFIFLLLVFAILFHLLLYSSVREPPKVMRGEGIHANNTFEIQHPFQDIYMSFVKVIAMMIGELDYTRFFVEQKNSIAALVIIVFVCFCAFLPIVLMNLLIGLAVGDIDTVQKNAEINLLTIKIDTIYEIEQKLPTVFLRYIYKPFIVIKPNKKTKGICEKLKTVSTQIAGNANDYDDILEDQEREDIETMEEVMNNLNNRLDEQDNRIYKVLKDVQQQRTTLDKLASALFSNTN